MIGRITGLFGVRGWVKVFSHTEPRENVLGYQPWSLDIAGAPQEFCVVEGRPHGKGIVAQLAGIDDRDAAAALIGKDIMVERALLGPAGEGEYYYADLEGLEVVTLDGVALGQIASLFETGANTVMVVRGERERLLPFTQGDVVRDVDVAAGRVTVDWDPDF